MADDVPQLRELTTGRFVMRVAWVAIQLLLAFYLGHSGSFFYQGF
jgi:hypothetical protein